MISLLCGARRGAFVLLLVWLLPAALPAAHAQQTVGSVARDTTAPAGRTITYEDAVRLALERNYQLRQARNDVTSQSITVDQNRAQFYPNVSFSTSGGENFGRNFSQDQGQIVNRSRAFRVGVNSQINLFNGFQDDATLDAAQARTQAAGRTLQRRRQDIVYQVLQQYIALAQGRALADVREEQLQLRQDQLEQTQAQIEVGERAPSAVYSFQADVAAARQALVQAERDAELAQTELVRLLVLDPFGTYTFETAALESRLPAADAPARPYQLDQLLNAAYAERADLNAQQATIAAGEQDVRAARAGWWPRLDLSLNYGTNWSNLGATEFGGADPDYITNIPGVDQPVRIPVPGTGQQSQFRQTPFFNQLDTRRNGGISVSLSYPLFDRFQTENNVEQAQVQLENTRFQEELLRQNIAVETRQALVSYRNARTSLQVTTEQVEAARQAQEAAQERYRLGAATYVELAQANADLAQAQSDRVNARYDLLLQRERLEYTTGRLDPDLSLSR